jgi:hypothetical protein
MNLLELVPRRLREFETDGEGIVTVKVKRFKYDWMAIAFLPKWKSPFIRTKLDGFGSHVWMYCDGEQNVHMIGEKMREEFGEEIEPVYDRLKLFFQQLTLRGFVAMYHSDGSPVVK